MVQWGFIRIIKAMDDASSFVRGMNYDTFVKDKKTMYATIRALEIIGEATKNIPYPIKARYPQIPWKEMAGMRESYPCLFWG